MTQENSSALRDRLRALIADGLTFGDAVQVMGTESATNPYAQAARKHTEEGTLELDDTTVVSYSEGGAYVLVWRWVEDDELGSPTSSTAHPS